MENKVEGTQLPPDIHAVIVEIQRDILRGGFKSQKQQIAALKEENAKLNAELREIALENWRLRRGK